MWIGGSLYNEYKDVQLDTDKIESETEKILLDDDVTKKSRIYPYILTRDEKYLSIHAFTDNMKHKVYEKQQGNCIKYKEHFELSEMEADHITPWHEEGGELRKKTVNYFVRVIIVKNQENKHPSSINMKKITHQLDRTEHSLDKNYTCSEKSN